MTQQNEKIKDGESHVESILSQHHNCNTTTNSKLEQEGDTDVSIDFNDYLPPPKDDPVPHQVISSDLKPLGMQIEGVKKTTTTIGKKTDSHFYNKNNNKSFGIFYTQELIDGYINQLDISTGLETNHGLIVAASISALSQSVFDINGQPTSLFFFSWENHIAARAVRLSMRFNSQKQGMKRYPSSMPYAIFADLKKQKKKIDQLFAVQALKRC
jgi:hypothetical protein